MRQKIVSNRLTRKSHIQIQYESDSSNNKQEENPLLLGDVSNFKAWKVLQSKPYFSEFKPDACLIVECLSRIDLGGMSLGSLSPYAHTTLAQVANELGIHSNTGEGGEDPSWYETNYNGSIKQVASGRFGVTIDYLLHADIVQIKIAQGAKPGEGGELHDSKVNAQIAAYRNTEEGVTLYSPATNHDLYSIEDLLLLIHAIKSIRTDLKISVKLAASDDVAILALAAAKAGANEISIAGDSGGTGAAKNSSIFNTGLPWEMGVIGTHLLLKEAGIRDHVKLIVSGGIKTGWDIFVALALGSDRVEIGTEALVSLGCIMVRQCHKGRELTMQDLRSVFEMQFKTEKLLDTTVLAWEELEKGGYIDKTGRILGKFNPKRDLETSLEATPLKEYLFKALSIAKGGCPVGVATTDLLNISQFDTQNKAKTSLENLLFFLAQSVAMWIKEADKRSPSDIIGKADELLEVCEDSSITNLSDVLRNYSLKPQTSFSFQYDLATPCQLEQALIEKIKQGAYVLKAKVNAKQVSLGAAISAYVVTRKISMPITIEFEGIGPQNFGVWLVKGITFILRNHANDHLGKGLSGGIIAVSRPTQHPAVVGNSVLYGATSGKVFIDGNAGTRFGIRNSGAMAVVEDVNDHALEYMSKGVVVICGKIGRNFASGMMGGLVFINMEILPNKNLLQQHRILRVRTQEHAELLKSLLMEHCKYTQSETAQKLLKNWEKTVDQFGILDPTPLNALTLKLYRSEAVDFLKIWATDHLVGQKLAEYGLNHPFQQPVHFEFMGEAGDHFGVFLPQNICFHLQGTAQEYCGRGLDGGSLVIKGDIGAHAFWRARKGSVYVDGKVGDAAFQHVMGGTFVVKDIGNQACRGMRGGLVLILGTVGSDFAQERTGGTLILRIESSLNASLAEKAIPLSEEEMEQVEHALKTHVSFTKSQYASTVYSNWDTMKNTFKKLKPYCLAMV